MTDITELAQSLKAAAEKATQGNWRAFQYHDGRCGIGGGHHDEIMVCEHISKERPHDAMFIALANPANVLALVEALEKAQAQSSKWLEAYHKAVSIGARYEEHIAELESRTVKLPPAVAVADWMVDIDVYEADLVRALLTATGIKVEAE
ncbi:ead/Ea22-like family protein [Klebsiella sp. Kps]|uniref:ead/Ea22-like family protein n=1 Tax=Klebsiella sp. Kps TaxID=2758579 RepID=UPI0016489C4F|nr:ead/Ea22-like family protein [Klebsiella sp. Kps]MBC3639987.1 ead/Ea22-like family protein [Klebsiella sp. Kps]